MVRLRAAAVAAGAAALAWAPTGADAQMSMLALGDWGGQPTPPFYNDVEVANANAMAGTMADNGGTTPEFGLLMGDNFYTRGIDCQGDPDPDCVTDSHSHRFDHTFEEVFDQPAFADFPFYVILGVSAAAPFASSSEALRSGLQNHDHYGNATAQLEYGTASMGSGRWRFPALGVDQLYYKVRKYRTAATDHSFSGRFRPLRNRPLSFKNEQ
jgi:hypothetical protein